MNTVIFGCKMVEAELQAILAESREAPPPIVWFEKSMHNVPNRLHDQLQAQLDALPDEVERVLFTFGVCGGCTLGLTSRAEMIFPRVDDCLTLLLGSRRRRNQCNKEVGGAYFLTEAWVDSDRSLMAEYRHSLRRYGEECSREIFQTMLCHYGAFLMLDTGLPVSEPIRQEARDMAALFGLDYGEREATLSYLRQLVTGPWPEDRFLILPPGQQIQTDFSDTSDKGVYTYA